LFSSGNTIFFESADEVNKDGYAFLFPNSETLLTSSVSKSLDNFFIILTEFIELVLEIVLNGLIERLD